MISRMSAEAASSTFAAWRVIALALWVAVFTGTALAEGPESESAPGHWYPVWSAALNHGLPAGVTEVVVLARTVTAPWSTIDDAVAPLEAGRETRLLDRFAQIQDGQPVRTPIGIGQHFDALANIVLMKPKTLAVLFASGPEAGWRALAERFPDSPGLIALSSVRFTEDGETAQVYVSFGCGVDCGAGRVITLGRDADANWQPLEAELLWVAAGEAPQPPPSTDGAKTDNLLGYPLEPDSAR